MSGPSRALKRRQARRQEDPSFPSGITQSMADDWWAMKAVTAERIMLEAEGPLSPENENRLAYAELALSLRLGEHFDRWRDQR